MELGTIIAQHNPGSMLPSLVTCSPRKGVVEWMFLGTNAEARAFIARKVTEGYTRAWFGTVGASERMIAEFQARIAAQAA